MISRSKSLSLRTKLLNFAPRIGTPGNLDKIAHTPVPGLLTSYLPYKSSRLRHFAPLRLCVSSALILLLAVTSSLASPRIRVAISPDNGRKDVLTPGWESWRIGKAKDTTKTVGDVTFTLRRAGSAGTGLAGDWWKAGIDYRATLTSGGVFIDGGDHGGQLELVIHGLTPGRHTIVTYHNAL